MIGTPTLRGFLVLVPVALLVVLGIGAWAHVFTEFRLYDDEGYILYTVRQFHDGLRIYDEFFTQYGPVYYLYTDVILRVSGATADHDWARLVTVLHWMGMVGFIWLSARAMRSTVAGQMLAALGAFFLLGANALEAGHPGGPIAFFYAAFLWLVLSREDARLRWFIGGAILGTILGMKINSGVFLVLAVSWGLLLANGLPRWLMIPLVSAYPILLIGLVRERIGDPSVLWFVALLLIGYAGTIASGGLKTFARQPQRGRIQCLIACGAGAAATLVLLLLVMKSMNSITWDGLIDGVIVQPLQLASSYPAPYNWSKWSYIAASIAVISIGLSFHPGLRVRMWEHIPIAASTGLFIAALGANGWRITVIGPLALETLFPCAWLIPALLSKREHPDVAGRATWVLILVMWAIWQAYPVPGSQIGWAIFPIALLWSCWLCMLGSDLARLIPGTKTIVRQEFLAALVLALAGLHAAFEWRQYRENTPLDLEGARNVRLQRGQVADLRVMANTARVHADTLLTYPGMLSLNLFSGIQPPGTFHVTHWYSLLDESRQEAVLAELVARERPVVISSPLHINYLRSYRILPPDNTLIRHIEEHYCESFGTYHFAFMTPCHGRRIFPVGTFSPLTGTHGEAYIVRIRPHSGWEQIRASGFVAGERASFSWTSGMYERRPPGPEEEASGNNTETIILYPPDIGTDDFQIEYLLLLDRTGREVDFAAPITRYLSGGQSIKD